MGGQGGKSIARLEGTATHEPNPIVPDANLGWSELESDRRRHMLRPSDAWGGVSPNERRRFLPLPDVLLMLIAHSFMKLQRKWTSVESGGRRGDRRERKWTHTIHGTEDAA